MSTSVHSHLKQNIKKNLNIHTELVKNITNVLNIIQFEIIEISRPTPISVCLIKKLCLHMCVSLINLHQSWCYFVPLMKRNRVSQKNRRIKISSQTWFSKFGLCAANRLNLETTLHLLMFNLGCMCRVECCVMCVHKSLSSKWD